MLDTDVPPSLNNLLACFDMIIAFDIIFFVKVSKRVSRTVRMDIKMADHLVARLITALLGATGVLHPRHLFLAIEEGI